MNVVKAKTDEIRKWIEHSFDPNKEGHREAILRAIRLIFQYQTENEKRTETTNRWNNVGFNGADAPFLSSLAKQSYPLTIRQSAQAARKMKKYSSQIAKIQLGVQR